MPPPFPTAELLSTTQSVTVTPDAKIPPPLPGRNGFDPFAVLPLIVQRSMVRSVLIENIPPPSELVSSEFVLS